jgi:hypothetical protein
MAKQPQSQSKIAFKYKFEECYNPIYVNGAVGGVTPFGEVVVNFYLERQPVPYSETHLVKDGAIGDLISRNPTDDDETLTVVRYISNGVVMSEESATRIYNWLGERLTQLKQMKENTKDGVKK